METRLGISFIPLTLELPEAIHFTCLVLIQTLLFEELLP